MTTRWDWRAELDATELADVAGYDAEIDRLSVAKRGVTGERLAAILMQVRLARAARLAIVNRGTARARMKAGLDNPARKARAAARLRKAFYGGRETAKSP